MAEIGWIDFSPEDRRRVGGILDALKTEGMVDELGIGILRDALSDAMFPGFSTIQTRAKYFFIIPYILYDYQRLSPAKRRGTTAAEYLEKREYEVMWDLGEKYHHRRGSGVIGIEKHKPQKIARRPSAIYWSGLYFYRFIDHGGFGVDNFLNRCHLNDESLTSVPEGGDDEQEDDRDAEHENHFGLHVSCDSKWAEDLSLDLTKDEAEPLLHRFREFGDGRLIGELVKNRKLLKIFERYDDFSEFVKVAIFSDVPDRVRKTMIDAHDFSEVIYGAHIAYNLLLQERKWQNRYYEGLWREWLKNIEKSMIDYNGFRPDAFFAYAPTVPPFTRKFIRDWWEFIRNSKRSDKVRDQLIVEQESWNKVPRARLRWKKMDDVLEEDWIGLDRLSYRMKKVKIILNDVQQGLKR